MSGTRLQDDALIYLSPVQIRALEKYIMLMTTSPMRKCLQEVPYFISNFKFNCPFSDNYLHLLLIAIYV